MRAGRILAPSLNEYIPDLRINARWSEAVITTCRPSESVLQLTASQRHGVIGPRQLARMRECAHHVPMRECASFSNSAFAVCILCFHRIQTVRSRASSRTFLLRNGKWQAITWQATRVAESK